MNFFGLQKTTPLDNYEGSNGLQAPIFPDRGQFRKDNLDWMKTSQKKLHGGLNFLNIEEKE